MRGLLFESSDGQIRFVVRAGGPTVIVGRRPPPEPHHVTIPDDPRVSREQFFVTGALVLEDARSAGGTLVDGQRVTGPVPLVPGAVIQIHRNLRFTTRALDDDAIGAEVPR